MKVLIVEDEFHTAANLRDIVNRTAGFEVVEMLESVTDAVLYLSEQQDELDLAFFDIHLADGHSFEIFKHIDVTIPVIFCTAYDEYTLNAIKNNGIDYILKPFKESDIGLALKKYQNLVDTLLNKRGMQAVPQEAQPKYQTTFISQYRNKSIVKQASEIAYFGIEHETVFFKTLTGRKYPLFKRLEYVESVIDPSLFFRVNRQMLVAREAISSFEMLPSRKLKLELKGLDDAEIIVSRLKVPAFKKWFG